MKKHIFFILCMFPIPLLADNFVVIGDAGEGNTAQYNVADAVGTICQLNGCDYALYAGDNFYNEGVSSPDDSQFQEKFELPYASLSFPFYVTLGNHDYGSIPIHMDRANHQVSYSQANPNSKFKLPSRYYKVEKGDVDLFVIDSNAIFMGFDLFEQRLWLSTQLALSTAKWKIVLGHHPYISNGKHGNAGNYEGLPPGDIPSGTLVKLFIEDIVCGHADVYISGHDHNLQWPAKSCGTEFIISGAGAKTTGLVNRNNNPTKFQYDATPGFVRISTGGSTLFPRLTAAFYAVDTNGVPTELYRDTVEKVFQPPCPPKAPCPELPSPTDPIPDPPSPPPPPCPPKGPCPTPPPIPIPDPPIPEPPIPGPPIPIPEPPIPEPPIPIPEPPIPEPPIPIPEPPIPEPPIPIPEPPIPVPGPIPGPFPSPF